MSSFLDAQHLEISSDKSEGRQKAPPTIKAKMATCLIPTSLPQHMMQAHNMNRVNQMPASRLEQKPAALRLQSGDSTLNDVASALGAAEERKGFRGGYRFLSGLVLGCVVLGLPVSLDPAYFPSLALRPFQTFYELSQHLLNEFLFSLNPPEMVSIAYNQEPCIIEGWA